MSHGLQANPASRGGAGQEDPARLAGSPGAEPDEEARGRGPVRLFAAGGMIGALLASSCCIAPLLLVMLGVSGAWIGGLTALAPYKPYLLIATALLIGAGFWRAYSRPRAGCAGDSVCARPASGRMSKAVLWIGAAMAAVAHTVNVWAPLFY